MNVQLDVHENREFFGVLIANLRSRFSETRLASLQVLSIFKKLDFIVGASDVLKGAI